MVTANQIGRAFVRGARAAHRQHLANQRAQEKQEILAAAADAVDGYERAIEALTKAHQRPLRRMDWHSTAQADVPGDPVKLSSHEEAAHSTLARYRPGWFAQTFGLAIRRRKALKAAITTAQAKDSRAFEDERTTVLARRDEIKFAKAVVDGDSASQISALEKFLDLKGTGIEGVNVICRDQRVIAVVDGYELDDMPTFSAVLLQSGKVSRRPLSTGKIYELHRDNICSAGLRVAAEFLRVLPLHSVEVVVTTDLLDKATGHIKSQPVFYAFVTAQALSNVKLESAEAWHLARYLGAVHSWRKTTGFAPIDLGPFDVELSESTDG